MAEKELRKLNRTDLLELLLNERKDNEKLSQEVEDLKKQLADKTIMIENAGSIAAASLQLNDIFTPAQQAAEQYLENIRLLEDRQKKKCEQMEKETEEKCRMLLEETKKRCIELILKYKKNISMNKETTNTSVLEKKDAT